MAKTIPLARAPCLQGLCEADSQWLIVSSAWGVGTMVNEPGEEVHEVERRRFPRGETLVLQRDLDEFLEVLDRRFIAEKRLGHIVPASLAARPPLPRH
jgi:hypothetical protein